MAEQGHTPHQDDEPLPDPVAVGHETSDAQAAPIVRFLVFLGIVTIVTAGLMVAFYNYLERREAAEKISRYPVAAGRERPMPPPPRLQTEPFMDVKDLRAAERQRLDRYEWIDRNGGIVRIPVWRAMELVAERGLPHRPPSGAPEQAQLGGAADRQRPTAEPPKDTIEGGAAGPRRLDPQPHE